MSRHNQHAPFCLTSDGYSVFGVSFAFNYNQDLNTFGNYGRPVNINSTYPDWIIVLQSSSTLLPNGTAGYNTSSTYFYPQWTHPTLSWTVVFSIPRAAVNLLPNVPYVYSCGVSTKNTRKGGSTIDGVGIFALHVQPYPDSPVQFLPSFLIQLPLTMSQTINKNSNNGSSILDPFSPQIQGPPLPNGIFNSTATMPPLLTLRPWTVLPQQQELQPSQQWYGQSSGATVLVAVRDLVDEGEDDCQDHGLCHEWVQIWTECEGAIDTKTASTQNKLSRVEIRFATTEKGVFPIKHQAIWQLQNTDKKTWVSVMPIKVEGSSRQGTSKARRLSPSVPDLTSIRTIMLPLVADCVSNGQSMLSSCWDTFHALCFNSTALLFATQQFSFNVRTNESLSVVSSNLPYNWDQFYPPSTTERSHFSMAPLYVDTEGKTLGILYSKGDVMPSNHYFTPLNNPGHRTYPVYDSGSLYAVSMNKFWNESDIINYSLYSVDSFNSSDLSQGLSQRNFSMYPVEFFSYYSSNSEDSLNVSATQMVLIVAASVVFPCILFGIYRCVRFRQKTASSAKTKWSELATTSGLSEDGRGGKRKDDSDSITTNLSEESTRIRSGPPSEQESPESRLRRRQKDRANGTEGEEGDIDSESDEPPGSKICESEETISTVLTRLSSLGTIVGSIATGFGPTVLHQDDQGVISLASRNRLTPTTRSQSDNDIPTAGLGQPPAFQRSDTGLTDREIFAETDDPARRMELVPLVRHRLMSVVTSFSNYPRAPPQDQTTTMIDQQQYAALTGIRIEDSNTEVPSAPLAPQISNTTTASGFLSVFYSQGSDPLQLWAKRVGPVPPSRTKGSSNSYQGDNSNTRTEDTESSSSVSSSPPPQPPQEPHIDFVIDETLNSKVLELVSTHLPTTFITSPSLATRTLGIKLPFLVFMVKNLGKYWTFEVTILDDRGEKRRFRASNFQTTTRVKPYITTMPMRMDPGWNQIQLNLADYTKRAYGTTYVETQRITIHANCRIRRIYFSDRLVPENELPAEFKLYLPVVK
ncbi:hypothetical protein BGZ83_008970 [Gryganskiella cystojenkinii]|nr:hypothetical protein BGZ83_008970 [Gryganskiella cystojenkinii]